MIKNFLFEKKKTFVSVRCMATGGIIIIKLGAKCPTKNPFLLFAEKKNSLVFTHVGFRNHIISDANLDK